MKKTLLLSLCLTACACFYAHAQVQKSDQNLGFGFDINSLGGDAEETRTNLFFTYTYFISNRLSIGVGPRFGWTKSTNSETDPTTGETIYSSSKSNTIGYNAFFNYSFLTSGGFVLPYFGAQYTKAVQNHDGQDDPFVTNSVGGNVGLKFFITERLNVDNNFSLTRIISQNETLDDLGLDVDGTVMQINVGLGYIIGRKN